MTIGIYSRVLKEEHIPYVVELIAQLSNKKITFFVFDEYYKALKKHLPKQKINTFKNHQDVKKKHRLTNYIRRRRYFIRYTAFCTLQRNSGGLY